MVWCSLRTENVLKIIWPCTHKLIHILDFHQAKEMKSVEKQSYKSAVNKSFCFECYVVVSVCVCVYSFLQSLPPRVLFSFFTFIWFHTICSFRLSDFIIYMNQSTQAEWMSEIERTSEWIWLKQIIFSFCDVLFLIVCIYYFYTLVVSSYFSIEVPFCLLFFNFNILFSTVSWMCVTSWQCAILMFARIVVSFFSQFLYQRRSKNK